MTIKEIIEISGLNKSEFSRKYNIPYRTLQHWLSGDRECLPYVLELLEFKVKYDIIGK